MQEGGAKRRVFTTQSLPLSPGYENRFSLPAQSLPLPVPVNLAVPPRTRRSTSPFNLVRRSRCKVNHDQIPEEFMLSNSPLSILPSEQHRPGRVSSARSKFSQLKKKSRESASSFKGISLNHILHLSIFLSFVYGLDSNYDIKGFLYKIGSFLQVGFFTGRNCFCKEKKRGGGVYSKLNIQLIFCL